MGAGADLQGLSLRNNDGARFTIAGLALVVLIIAIAFSKRSTEAMDADIGGEACGDHRWLGADT